MADQTSREADLVSDVIAPSLLIAGLIIANAFVFAYIMKQRKNMPKIEEPDLAAGGDASANDNDNEIEMERL